MQSPHMSRSTPIAEQAVGRAAMCSRACIAHSWRSASQFSSSDPERILGQPALSRRGSFSSCSRDTIWQSSSSEQKPSAPVEPSPWLGLSSIFFIVYPVDSMPAERLSGRKCGVFSCYGSIRGIIKALACGRSPLDHSDLLALCSSRGPRSRI